MQPTFSSAPSQDRLMESSPNTLLTQCRIMLACCARYCANHRLGSLFQAIFLCSSAQRSEKTRSFRVETGSGFRRADFPDWTLKRRLVMASNWGVPAPGEYAYAAP